MQISEQIKERLDIVEVISGYIQLNKAGTNFKGLCPFHREKTPSFMVSPDKQIWHCFGCNEGGDIFKFVMKYESLEFSETLKILAKRAGIELTKRDPKVESQLNRLYTVCEKANDFFVKNLKENEEAKKYLLERGLKMGTIEQWDIGFAGVESDGLFNHLSGLGFSNEDISLAGLAIKSTRKPNSFFDRFRSRIIFPIADNSGRVVGFTGRIFKREESKFEPKYLNSPENLIFNKRKILYGFSENKKNIREKESAVLVEGQMDFLMAWQSGIKNVVASSGTALSLDQLNSLRRLAKKLVVAYDSDDAGKLAAERAVDMAKSIDFQTYILGLPEGIKDLAEYLSEKKGEVKDLLESTFESNQYYYNLTFKDLDKDDLEKKNRAIRYFLTKISQTPSPIERSHWLEKISKDLDIKINYLEEELARVDQKKENSFSSEVEEKELESKIFHKSRLSILSDQLLALALKKEELKLRLKEVKNYLSKEHLNIAELIIAGGDEPKEVFDKMGYLNLLIDYEFSEERDLEKEFYDILSQLKKEILKAEIEQKNLEIKKAEEEGDQEGLEKHLKAHRDLSNQISEF